MKLCCALAVLVVCPAVYCQNPPQPFTHVEACKRFPDAVVQVKTDQGVGSGFIVGSDGWIITAFHVIADPQTLNQYGNPRVIIGASHPIDAKVVSPINRTTSLQDFAILKIEKTHLPKLELETASEVVIGSPVAIIGFPLSAMAHQFPAAVPMFCLAGTIAAQTAIPLGNLRYFHAIYFQGVSIKGISGAPIILLDSGKVIGIVSTKLTGIGPALADLHNQILAGSGSGISINGFIPGPEIGKIIDVLDNQLANGLGSGTGASDAVNALKEAQHVYKKAK